MPFNTTQRPAGKASPEIFKDKPGGEAVATAGDVLPNVDAWPDRNGPDQGRFCAACASGSAEKHPSRAPIRGGLKTSGFLGFLFEAFLS